MIQLSQNGTKEMNKIMAGVAIKIIKSVADTIKEAKRVPAGTIYAALMTQGCTIQQYEQIESVLTGSGIVRKENNELVWNVA